MTTPEDGVNESIIEVLEIVGDDGERIFFERYEKIVPFSLFVHGDQYKLGCEGCGKRGRNLACPPYSPSLMSYCRNSLKARVICIRMPQELFSGLVPEEQYRACYRKAKEILAAELLESRTQGLTVAGSGPCLVCEECAALSGIEECADPEELIYSLESLGVNLIALARDCFSLDFEWDARDGSAAFICAMGAVFL